MLATSAQKSASSSQVSVFPYVSYSTSSCLKPEDLASKRLVIFHFFWFAENMRGWLEIQIDYLFANKTSCRRFQDTIKVHRATYGDVLEIPGEVTGKHFDDKTTIGVEQVEDNSV